MGYVPVKKGQRFALGIILLTLLLILTGCNFPGWGAQPETAWPTIPAAPQATVPPTASPTSEPQRPVPILLTGNHTNLAETLRLDPSSAQTIAVVEIMSGALDVLSNIASPCPAIPNEVAEWNIWVDPAAAQDGFSASIPLRLVPLDATNQVVWTEADAAAWGVSPEGAIAAEILRWMLRSWFSEGVYAWNMVAAADMTSPEACVHSERFGSRRGLATSKGERSSKKARRQTPASARRRMKAA